MGAVGASSVSQSDLLVAGLSRKCVVLYLFVVTQDKNMAWSSSLHCNIHPLNGNLYHRLAHQTVSSSCLDGRCSSINWACSQLLKLLLFLLLRGKFIIARMSVPALQYLNLQDIELNPTLPAPSKCEWILFGLNATSTRMILQRGGMSIPLSSGQFVKKESRWMACRTSKLKKFVVPH